MPPVSVQALVHEAVSKTTRYAAHCDSEHSAVTAKPFPCGWIEHDFDVKGTFSASVFGSERLSRLEGVMYLRLVRKGRER